MTLSVDKSKYTISKTKGKSITPSTEVMRSSVLIHYTFFLLLKNTRLTHVYRRACNRKYATHMEK